MEMLISCIITTYKRPVDIVKRAIDSVASQTYANLELIVVNDYPDDKELSDKLEYLVHSYEKRMPSKYILQEKNSGACAARNQGLVVSKGVYVAFLDDDDEWLPEKLSCIIPLFESDKDIGLVYSQYFIINNNKKTLLIPSVYNEGRFEHLLGENYIGSTSFPVLNKKVLINAGMFDIEMLSMQDWDTWLRVAKISKISYCAKPLSLYHVEKDSITKNVKRKQQGHEKMINKYRDYYQVHKDQYAIRLDVAAYDFMKYGSYKLALEYFIKGIITYPFSLYHLKIIKRIFKCKFK